MSLLLLIGRSTGTGGTGAPVTLTDTSDDLKLDARYLSDRRGVLLRAKFLEATLQNHGFESTVESWVVAAGGGTVSRTTSFPLAGAASLNLAWTTGGSKQAVSRTYTGGSIIPGGRQMRISFKIQLNEASASGTRTVYFKTYNSFGKLTDEHTFPFPGISTLRSWYHDFWLASDQNIAKLEIGITGATNNHSFKLDDVKIIEKAPPKVRFVRVTDGGYVRGGDPAETVQGYAYAFDDELTPGKPTKWAAEPVFDTPWVSRVPFYVGTRTGTVGFTIEDRDDTKPSHLVKSLETPGLILYLMTNQRQVVKGRDTVFVNKQNTGKPAGGINSAYSMSGDYLLITQTPEDLDQFELILEEAVMFVQPPGRYNRRPFYATVTQYAINDFGKMSDPEKTVVISFQEVERPDTFGQPNYLPLRDYTWLSEEHATYNVAALIGQTYDQLSFSSVP